MKILLVDDSPMQQKIARIYLEKGEGYEVLTASNGKDGLSLAVEALPDMVLLDFEMPDMDGITALKALKSNPATSAIPVIMCTASEDDGIEQLASSGGAVGFIKKPHGFKNLSATIKKLNLLRA